MLVIKPTALHDVRVIELVRQLDAYQSVMYPAESDYSMPLSAMASNEHYLFIAEVDGVAAGCACLYICDDGLAEIKRVYVNPDFRGLGIADRLMNAVEEQAQRLQLPSLYLETGVDHLAAIGLYQKRGFIITDCFGAYSYDPLSVYMVKPLDPRQRD